MHGDIGDVLARFPQHSVRIREQADRDERFREVCADYAECMAAFRRWRVPGAADDERVEQYDDLRLELEQELGAVLSRADPPGAKPCDGDHP